MLISGRSSSVLEKFPESGQRIAPKLKAVTGPGELRQLAHSLKKGATGQEVRLLG
jgi:hypothetical protein